MTRLSVSSTRLCSIVAVCMALSACKKGDETRPDALGTSLIFGDASPDAREALATPVNFRLTDANYAQWEAAQQFLDALPRSALPATSGQVGGGRNLIDRAVARLESSPRARTAIERTGLSVRDFVLETIALAQATDASASGKMVSGSPIAAENLQFVQRYRSRILRARAQARVARTQSEGFYEQRDSAAQAADAVVTDTDGRQEAQMQKLDTTVTSERAAQRSETRNDTLPPPTREPARDSVRDSLPAR